MSAPVDSLDKPVFYDIHMHAFNLSHPSLSIFTRRAVREMTAKLLKPRHWHLTTAILGLGLVLGVLWIIFAVSSVFPWLGKKIRRMITRTFSAVQKLVASALNMLAVFDNDLGSMLLLMENCLRHPGSPPLISDNQLRIGDGDYSEIVLTPLMMDFGHKWKTPPTLSASKHARRNVKLCHYDVPAEKPIVAQVVDVFAAIQKYLGTSSEGDLHEDYPELKRGTKRIFHIFPFLGINPANYELDGVKGLLDKYFSNYRGLKEDLDANMGQFDGHIENLGSNFFAGIKVYPPLGFNPWPDDAEQRDKVHEIYRVSEEKGIPITCHGGSGGFRAIPLATAIAFANVDKWAAVLTEYPELKLNLAHFPMSLRESGRRSKMFQLLLDSKNVYVDISCRATNPSYYDDLRRFAEALSEENRAKFMHRVLFGSDFAVNLLWSQSYNAYVRLFAETTTFSPDEKRALCSTNPERFLFNAPPSAP